MTPYIDTAPKADDCPSYGCPHCYFVRLEQAYDALAAESRKTRRRAALAAKILTPPVKGLTLGK